MMRYIIAIALTSLTLPAFAPAFAEVPKVVTDSPAVHALTTQVMGALGTPELLLDRGADPHSFQLRPSQAAGLAKADLVVWVGPALTPWLERALDGLAPDAERLTLLEDAGTYRRSFSKPGETAPHDDHAQEEDHGDHDHDHDGHGHEDGGIDPHAWLDPANAAHWAGLIAASLGRVDPENAVTYTENAKAAQEEIARLDAAIDDRLAPARNKRFVVFHDAYGYFTDHFDLPGALAISLGDASAPGAARLADLRQQVTGADVVCLFPEAQHDPALIEQLAAGSSARIGAPLDPSGSTVEPGKGAYAQILNQLADRLVACLAP